MQYNFSVPVAQKLLEILVCPVCKQSVTLTDQRDGLKCSSCGRIYPVIDDIPVMLVDRARQG
jgi:uncharacterized protein YbaR (Trm112 family)